MEKPSRAGFYRLESPTSARDGISPTCCLYRKRLCKGFVLLWVLSAITSVLYLSMLADKGILKLQPKPLQVKKYGNMSTSGFASQKRTTVSQPIATDTWRKLSPTLVSNSFFYIRNPKANYNICDQLELYIEARDAQNKTKTRGGDHMWPFLRTASLNASAPADELIDHGNGTYTARFSLHWAGEVEPQVRFVFSREHAHFLRSVRERVPDRFTYDGKFTDNRTIEITPCHINRNIFVDRAAVGLSYASKSEVCDLSDRKAGTTWFCLKPATLTCANYAQHKANLQRKGREYVYSLLLPNKRRVAHSQALLQSLGRVRTVHVNSGVSDSTCLDLSPCYLGLPPKRPHRAAGYYFRDLWKSKVCHARELRLTDTLRCLRNKRLYFYGDSTIRQWFEYLVAHLGDSMKEERITSITVSKVGLRRGWDATHNITLFFRHHEYPIRNSWIDVANIKFTVNEIDGLPGGADTVVALTMFAHFTHTNLTYYQSRLERVRDAIGRLQRRGAGTSPVFIKSANTGNPISADTSDLYAYDLDQTMRAVFADSPDVTILDVWDMTLSHRSGYNIHPVEAVVREESKMFLNFLCSEAVSTKQTL
ncbi:NXPE family member 3-like [Acanthaster planci]|uniref:NXPE family member 3-like n=1 Tax=Acanthaster planci TaxID=133434 RepID=A0A8B7YKF4_ACAPL|nr:NXPE family member 3-like [Acanthaster planci]